MRGKYITLCEGDDYWIDPLKLLKQVDFMEADNSYGLVYCIVNYYKQRNKKFIYKFGSYLVTGYRGMGKTSLVNKVIDGITREKKQAINILYYISGVTIL